MTPFGRPSAPLVVALFRARAFGVLDVGTSSPDAVRALSAVAAGVGPEGTFGVRVGDADVVRPDQLPAAVSTVVIAAGSLLSGPPARWGVRRVVVEVTSLDEAYAAVQAGADGIIAKGAESGGRVGDIGAFVLFQQLAAKLDIALWCQGGMGLHTAAAAVAAGATGVVFDTQLALVKEMQLPTAVRAALGAMDGAETAVVGDHRVFVRPDVAAADGDAGPGQVAARLGIDLTSTLLPAGQDAAFAASLAKRFHTAGGVVHAVRTAIGSQLRSAAASHVFGPGSAFAEAFGLRYPIAQGPMTRVSDKPAFAAAVASEGALPFLALALMAPGAARELLEETKALLGGRTWGVGILGFVPPELRAGQLAAVLDAGPAVALIAGGRPSLARPLEDAGIATFLHVPSPGLLELFVREGARRFVFEGRECGGHVGPRSSFVLWEQQISQLLKGDVEGMDVLFAGGIHDARSAAMVAAMAAPLAERGARLGVLMGTAYLFTDEAVATGAIRAPFQDAAVACRRTALLETAPGHTTRCADTAFVGRFNDERQALEAAGVGGPDRWAALEDLNLGRLRIAAKGLRRDGDVVVEVGEDEQRRDGMYMIGEIAILRSEATTVAALHRVVSVGSAAVLDAALRAETPPPAPVDVAVIGMACLFPGAEDVAQYWTNIVAGTSHVSEVPAERWDSAVHTSREAIGPKGTVTPSRWGGFLDPTPFNPMKYGIPPASLGAIEPVQLLSLEVAANALADAGYAEREFDRTRTSVVFGVEGASDLSSAYVFRALAPGLLGSMPAALDEHLPALTEDSFPGVLSNVIAGRIANRLDLGGANFSVDAACAASLAAVHMGCQELVTGGSDMILSGGADLHNGIYDYQLFASVGALSATGACKSFDESADGIALGEGVACVVLKRLADATRDGDRIYAVIKGVGASSDGRSLGLTAPRGEGQRVALERAYQRAGVAPETVGLVEAHGTGTVVGDRTELATLTDFFTEAGSEPGSCALGSVKAQIGHTKCAAGMAGLIKACLALHHAVRPPTAHITRPSAVYDAATSPFAFAGAARPWSATSRRAGVSAFGFGGSNFHVVLDSFDDDGIAAHGMDQWPAELFAFRGQDHRAVRELIADLRDRIGAGSGARLRDLAGDLWARGAAGDPVRVAIVATTMDDLTDKLARADAEQPAPGVYLAGHGVGPAGIAFLFPGQGSQRPGMLADLFVAFPRLHELLRLGPRYQPVMFPATDRDPARTAALRAKLNDTLVAQPTIGMAGLAMARLLGDLGVVPDALGGHSYGEMVALSVAGAFSPAELIRLSEQRAAAMATSSAEDPGGMAAVDGSADRVAGLLDRWPAVVVANDNSPRQVVISGPTADVTEAARSLNEQGMATRPLPVSCGFHSPLMAAAAAQFAGVVGEVAVGTPAVPVWSNLTAGRYPDDPDGVRNLLVGQVDNPVRFREQIEAMYAAGIGTFVEVGPGRVLTGLIDQILAGRPHQMIATDAPGVHGVEQLLHAVAALGVGGARVSLDPLFEGRDIAGVGARQSTANVWMIDGHLVRSPDGRPVPGGLRPATEVPAMVAAIVPVQAVAPEAIGRTVPATVPDDDPVMLEYLRGIGQMVSAGHDLMARYLGARSGAPLSALNGAEIFRDFPIGGSTVPPADVAVAPNLVLPWSGLGAKQDTTGPTVPPAGPVVLSAGAGSGPRSREELLAAIVAVVSERTGYPVEMLGADLDLEADLSIDSIKRIEIVGDLVVRVGLADAGAGGLDDALVEQLTVLKTMAEIVEWILGRADPPMAGGPVAAAAIAVTGDAAMTIDLRGPDSQPHPPARAGRFIQRVEPAGSPAGSNDALAGRRFFVSDDGTGIAPALVELLEQRGAQAAAGRLADGWMAAGMPDGLIHLASLSPTAPTPAELFGRLVAPLGAGFRSLLFVTGTGGGFGRDGAAVSRVAASDPGAIPSGAGLRGMARSLAREFPDVQVRSVDVDPDAAPAVVAGQLLAELLARDPLVEVGYRSGRRLRLRTVPEPLVQNGAVGVRLGRGDVVLLTGGGRGITAAVAITLARLGCHLELVGRTPLSGVLEDPATAACADDRSLREHLAGRGLGGPSEVQAEWARITGQRQLHRTLDAIASAGGSARYHALDVRDGPAMAELVDDIYRRHGMLDGIIHGAGVVEDRLAADKTVESFARVYDTKVEGARALLAAARPGCRFVVLFGSVSGAFGNRGQVDYAAANEALEAMAWAHNGGDAGRVVCIHWGPWGGTGMVSDGLQREFARRGVGLIDPEEGAACLVRELSLGPPSAAAVVVMRARPEQLGAGVAPPPVGAHTRGGGANGADVHRAVLAAAPSR